MGGRYFALEASISDNNSFTGRWEDRRIALRYGLQQRFMRNGYFDISIGAGITDPSSILRRPKEFSTDQQMAVGLAAFLPKSKSLVQSGGLCDVLHCQDEQYKMLKINLFNLLNFQSNGDIYNIEFRPNIAFEQKIGRLPFSVEVDIETGLNNSKIQYNHPAISNFYYYNFTSADWNATGELRWYYNMRKRILSGRSGNNLSGTFFGLQASRQNLIKNAVSFKNNWP